MIHMAWLLASFLGGVGGAGNLNREMEDEPLSEFALPAMTSQRFLLSQVRQQYFILNESGDSQLSRRFWTHSRTKVGGASEPGEEIMFYFPSLP